jgi:hypothetical protein
VKKTLIVIAIILVAVLAAAEFYVQSGAFADRVRASVVGPLKEILGPRAEIGSVRANFIPPYLEVRDISLLDAKDRQAIAVRKVTIYINPLPLLFKKIRLPLITVLEPRIQAERGHDGAINLTPILDRITSQIAQSSSKAPSGYSLMLRTISIRKARLEFKDETSSIRVGVTGLTMSARANLANDRFHVTIRSSEVRVSAPAYPELAGTLKASADYDHGHMHLDSAELKSRDASILLSGDVGPLPEAALDLRAKLRSGPQTINRLTDLLKPSAKQKGSRVEASVIIKGKASDPHIDGNFRFSDFSFRGVTLQEAALTIQYRDHELKLGGEKWLLVKSTRALQIDSITATLGYRQGGLDVRPFEVKAGDLVVHMEGRADPSTGFAMTLSVASSGGQTLSILTSVPVEGKASLDGNLSGSLTAPVFEGTVMAGPVTVRHVLFNNVRGDIEYREKKIKISSVHIHQQSSRYTFEGMVDFKDREPAYTARLHVLQSDVVGIVALFYKPIPLKMTATGVLSFLGSGPNYYSGNGYLAFDAGSAYGESFSRGTIAATLTAGKIAFPQVTFYKGKGMIKGTGWIGFNGTYSADLECRDVNLTAIDHLSGIAVGGDSMLSIHSSGSFSAPTVKASLDVRDLTFRRMTLGSMHAEADIKDGLMNLSADLSEDRAHLLARWELRKPYAWSTEAKIDIDGIDPLLLFGEKNDSGKMRFLAKGSINGQGKGMDLSSVKGEAVFHSVGIIIGDYRIDNESDANISLANGRVIVKSLNFAGPGTRISIAGATRLFSDVDVTFTGNANLSLMKLMYREVEHAAGAAEVKLTIKDKWDSPDVAGVLRLQNGEIKIKDIPQKFMALNGTMTFTQGKIVTDSLTGEMGGGTLGMSGWAQLAGFSLLNFSARATVDNVTVRYPEGLTSTLSGNLYYDGDASTQALSGDITIKHARYDKTIEWKSMMVDIGKGLYQRKKTDVGWIGDTQVNIRFHGAESIVFQNNLAKMQLDVDMFLRGTVNHPQLLGRIEARKGTVYFRKNEFKILSASADFIDPNRMNPVLDIQAETQVREYLIRLAVTGTADRASVTLVSDPPLIDTDILSMLALGKRGTELKGKETGVGVGEAASFATGQFQDVFERRARGLTGLDRFQIDPYVGKSDISVPRVTVGKELVQNKLYFTYSSNVGTTAPEQIFRIEYILNKHFSLVGERNDEMKNNGADIKYRFEFQ